LPSSTIRHRRTCVTITDAISRLASVRARIEAACLRAGRDPDEVDLLAASKYADAPAILELAAAGQRLFGENRVQDAAAKVEELPHMVRKAIQLHLIGHLQSNKARLAAGLFDAVQSVDSLSLATELARKAAVGSPLPVLVQVNVAADPSKSGFTVEDLRRDEGALLALEGVAIMGLMTIGPPVRLAEESRPTFAGLRELRDHLADRWPSSALRHLSMGMSDDFEVAIEEGATILRVGTALFGDHHAP
jgi:pyridoxal phosphate enzyme (YggS family)